MPDVFIVCLYLSKDDDDDEICWPPAKKSQKALGTRFHAYRNCKFRFPQLNYILGTERLTGLLHGTFHVQLDVAISRHLTHVVSSCNLQNHRVL